MGVADAIARRAWAVILVWLAVAALSAPLASKLNNVIVTEEKGFLPSNVESIRAEEALGGSKTEPDAVIVVEGVNVSLGAYWRLRGPWHGIEWGNATHMSWISVLDKIYEAAYNASLEGVNASVAGLEGFEKLWNATVQAREGFEKLDMLLNTTAKSLAGADRAYSGYTNAARSLENAKPGLARLLESLTAMCRGIPKAYAAALFDVVRAEYLIENSTQGYERGYLTREDVAKIVEASNLSNAGIPPLQPSLVVTVFNLTLEAGGPDAFNNALAAWEAYVILNSTLPAEVSAFLESLQEEAARVLSTPSMPDLRFLASQGPEGMTELLDTTMNVSLVAAPKAAADYGWEIANSTGSPIVGWAAEAYAEKGCDPSVSRAALAYAMEKQLVGNKMSPLPAHFIAVGVAWGNLTAEAIAGLSIRIVAAEAAEAGAPPLLVGAINSSRAVEILLKYDPHAEGSLAANVSLARVAAAELLSAYSSELQVEPGILYALARGATPEELALEAVESMAPPEARPLIELFKERGIPGTLEDLINVSIPVMIKAAVERGASEDQARAAVLEAVKVFRGEESLEAAAESLAKKALETAWPKVMEEIEGSMVSRDHRAFLVILFNVSYDEAKRLEDEIANATESALPGASPRILATGGVVSGHEMREAALRDVEKSDRVSMILVFIILAIVLESIVAVFLPFTGIGMGLVTALGLAYLLARGDLISVTTMSRTIMFTTGLGLGIDYSALISRRFREELARLGNKRDAAAAALRVSARPIAAGATTAAIGFGSLALAWDFPFLKSIGTTVPLAIAFVAAASLTFIPALLALIGSSRILWWPVGPRARSAGKGARFLRGVASRRAVASILIVLVLIALIPAIYEHARFEGSHDLTIMMPEGTETLEGLRVVNTRFDPGVLYPLYIVPSNSSAAREIAERVGNLTCIARALLQNTSSGLEYILAVPSVNPLSTEGAECARSVREAAHSVDPGSLVGGTSAVIVDLEELLNERFYHRVLPAAVVLMFLSMLAAYGGVIVALAAVAVVTIAAEYSIGLTVYYYQSVKGMPVPWFLPIVVFTAILGVGMDYNSFSISRAAEECIKKCDREAVAEAVSKIAILVLGLAAIMTGAYGGLMLSSTPNLRMTGLSLLLGVLFAGVLASIALTPPLIALLGRAAWLPWGPKAEAHSEEGGED